MSRNKPSTIARMLPDCPSRQVRELIRTMACASLARRAFLEWRGHSRAKPSSRADLRKLAGKC